MKSTLRFLFVAAMFPLMVNGQAPAWVQSVETNISWQGIVCDEEGDAYLYGFSGGIVSNQPGKAIWISRYRMDGKRKYVTQVPVPITITKMIHDGKDRLYFTGNFYGTFFWNGKTFTSAGNQEGAVGCLDENGKLQWIVTMGSPKGCSILDICMNNYGTRLAVTGSVDGNFSFNGLLVEDVTEKSLLLAELSHSGQLTRYRTYNFINDVDDPNIGNELASSPSGGYFVLGRREGAAWIEQNPTIPYSGHYVFCLDNNLNISWQRMVINGSCYYGNFSRSLRTDGEHVMVTTYCSGKYGGTGKLYWLSGSLGKELWSRSNTDAYFRDACYSMKKTIFLTADDAIGCPCESNTPGHEVVREIDELGVEKLLIKAWGRGVFRSLAQNRFGMTFVTGISHDSLSIGKNVVPMGAFLFALGDPPAYPAEAVDLQNETTNELRLYPNPANGLFVIEGGNELVASINLFDLTGREIPAKSTGHSSNELHLDVSNVPPGTYFLHVHTENAVVVRKIVVQR
jgi:hypothetical protein